MKRLLIVTSVLEGATGLALITKPSFIVTILLGSPLSDQLSILITRLAGAALVTLAFACWFSRNSKDTIGLIIALFFYNLASVVLLGYAGLNDGQNGIALWPAIVSHIALAAWCVKLLLKK